MQISGLFKAEVIDTSEFKELGKIRVRILGLQPVGVDTYASIMTPFGGLPNMGMQMVPPMDSSGFVLFERARENLCVWIGAALSTFGDEFNEGYGNPVEAEKPEDFLIKTQHLTEEDKDIATDGNRVENIIKMNKKELTLAKVNHEYKKEAYSMNPSEEPDLPYQIISMKDDGIVIKYKPTDTNDGEYMTVNMMDDGVRMIHNNNTGTKTIEVGSDDVTIETGSTRIIVNYNGNVTVEGEEIHLNGNSETAMKYEGWRDFVNNVFLNHQHGSSCGGTLGKVIARPNTKPAKSDSVKLV